VAVVAVAVDKENMMTTIKTIYAASLSLHFVRLASCLRIAALALLLSVSATGRAAEQQTFATPEAAVSALIDAFKADDEAALISIFGERHKRLVVSPDQAENAALRTNVLARLQAWHALEDEGPARRILLIGDEAWPVPIPLVREQGAWRFATEQGEDEIINRRIGANEREAIVVLRAYLDAQRQYAARDRNGDEVLEYAQKLGSTPGQHDGLYWPADEAKGEEASPFGPLIAASADYLKGHRPGDSFHGYHFRILTRQGKNAPGGAFSYLINGRMIAGFAMLAYPAQYGESGVMTFIVNNLGKIYQKDLGAATGKRAARIREFNPDESWTRVDDRD
jgi:hypothetical protein